MLRPEEKTSFVIAFEQRTPFQPAPFPFVHLIIYADAAVEIIMHAKCSLYADTAVEIYYACKISLEIL